MRLAIIVLIWSGVFGATARAVEPRGEPQLSPVQRKILYGNEEAASDDQAVSVNEPGPAPSSGEDMLPGEESADETGADEDREADEAADEDAHLAGPMRELLGRLSPAERRDFFRRHPGVKEAVGWKERSNLGRIYSSSEESELMRKDSALREEKAEEQEQLQRHVRPAAGSPPPEPAESLDANPEPAAPEPAPPAAAAPPPAPEPKAASKAGAAMKGMEELKDEDFSVTGKDGDMGASKELKSDE